METITSQMQHLAMATEIPPLLHMPTELILTIGEALPTAKDLACFRATCLALNEILQPLFGSHMSVRITMDAEGIATLDNLLNTSGDRLKPVAPFVRRILIADLGHRCYAKIFCCELKKEELQALQAGGGVVRQRLEDGSTSYPGYRDFRNDDTDELDVYFDHSSPEMQPSFQATVVRYIADALSKFPKLRSADTFLKYTEDDILYNASLPFKLDDPFFIGAEWATEGIPFQPSPAEAPLRDAWYNKYELRKHVSIHEGSNINIESYQYSYIRPGYLDFVKLDALMSPQHRISKLLQRFHLKSDVIHLRDNSGLEDDPVGLVRDMMSFLRRCDELRRLQVSFGHGHGPLTHLKVVGGHWWRDGYTRLIKGREKSLQFLDIRASYNVEDKQVDYLTPFLISCTAISRVLVAFGSMGFEQFNNGRGFDKLLQRMAWRWHHLRAPPHYYFWLSARDDDDFGELNAWGEPRGRVVAPNLQISGSETVDEVQDAKERAKEYKECFASVRFD